MDSTTSDDFEKMRGPEFIVSGYELPASYRIRKRGTLTKVARQKDFSTP